MEHYEVKQTSGNCIGRIFTIDEERTEIHFLEESKCDTIVKYKVIKRNKKTIRLSDDTQFIIGVLIE